MIRPIAEADLPDLCRVQLETLPGTAPSRFGSRFLRLYYRALLPDPRFFCDGFFWDSQLGGFLAYSSDSAGLLAAALRRRFFSFAFVLAAHIILHPASIGFLLRTLRMVLAPQPEAGIQVPAELLSFGVLPAFRRSSKFSAEHGISVAQQLLRRAFAVLRQRGASQVKIFVPLAEVNPFINEFYRRVGFEFVAPVSRLGLPCNLYVRNLLESDRLPEGAGLLEM